MSAPDLNAVRVFVQIVDSGSFREAARSLGMPKSTVNRKVAELEKRLGVQLLLRSTRSMGLTEAGRAYLRHARVALAALLEAEHAIAEEQGSPQGQLRISVSVHLGLTVLPELFHAFLRRYPRLRLAVELSDEKVDLIQRHLDAAIRLGPLPDSGLTALRLGQCTPRLFASPEYLKERGEPRSPEELLTHDCLVQGQHTEPDWTLRGARGLVTVKPHPRLFINDFLPLRSAALAGLGIVRMPGHLGEEAVQRGRLHRVLEDYTSPPLPIHLLYPSARLRAPTLRAFIAFMKERTAHPDWIS